MFQKNNVREDYILKNILHLRSREMFVVFEKKDFVINRNEVFVFYIFFKYF